MIAAGFTWFGHEPNLCHNAAYSMQFILKTSNRSRKALQPLLRYLIVSIGFVALAMSAGIESSTFLVISGSIGIGLGIGLKEPFLNFVTGIWLLLEGAIKPGEILMIENEPCLVKHLGLRATFLRRQRDEAELLIPNQILFSTKAESFTEGENDRKESIVVGAAYHHDPQHIIGLLEEIAQSHKRVLNKPIPKAFASILIHRLPMSKSLCTHPLMLSTSPANCASKSGPPSRRTTSPFLPSASGVSDGMASQGQQNTSVARPDHCSECPMNPFKHREDVIQKQHMG